VHCARTAEGRRLLLSVLRAALGAVDGRTRVRSTLQAVPLNGPVYLVALGKAAVAMAAGAYQALGERIVAGLIVTKPGHGAEQAAALPARLLLGGHPIPDENSLRAGRALCRFLDRAPEQARFLALISGGASALVEVLPAGLRIEDLQRTGRWLLGSGLDIAAMNRVRKGLSLIKAGRLARHLRARPVRVLAISDVPGDDPSVIGSGLFVGDPDRGVPPPFGLPPWLHRFLGRGSPPPAPDDPLFRRVDFEIVARLDDALCAAAEHAESMGLTAHLHRPLIVGDACLAGRRMAIALRQGERGLHIWGGETTIELPPRPGRGGRNQHLALCAAQILAGTTGIQLLAVGSDGTDGPGNVAGALVDGATVALGTAQGRDVERALAAADSGSFLVASGDLVYTGPSGTNVMDLALGLKL
jgi:glycerate 2-kinase